MGKVEVTLYGALAKIAGEKIAVVEGSTVKEIVNSLSARYGERVGKGICDEEGRLRRFVNIYVNGKDIRFLNQLEAELEEGDKISIVPAVGGG